MVQLDSSYPVSAFLRFVAARQERGTSYNLYWEDCEDDPLLTDTFLVAAPAEVHDDALVFPEGVQQRGWWLTARTSWSDPW